ncbi:4-(cytidine 5'-diphospho)-2-C-methyl-D-erythritol kinase [Wolbachia pipientis]|uniref:4-diphosphocytidyl-2-C-methyl-D-erythritol kinase n=1 Tax=Wolbachia pipientis TaxID=955 RepID=A0A1E7QKF4_WOLPI|nr:4-(cytidine 5'-diphospho)-2-C-methyl-D-erythritol kinase [Wolbachia pipientis]OEY86948.1 4-(cytidine 5'-diphospho)-2-C-methyl-D-erythritol kinase [Wolbachia pipientis]
MQSFCVNAYAKVNLFLHIVGKKENGYHLIESVFVFATLSNMLEIKVDHKKFKHDYSNVEFVNSSSRINSRYNTVIRAVKLLLRYAPSHTKVFVKVIKNIPIAAGLGSGSSDAGAVVRTLGKLWNVDRPILDEIALNIGADIPASIDSNPVFVQGVGEELHPIEKLSLPMNIVLVKPKKKFLSTPEVYSRHQGGFTKPIEWNEDKLLDIVKNATNDLQEIAISLIPEIKDIILTLELQKGCLIARMSGSGTVCFGMFNSMEDAKVAASNIKEHHPDWWVCDTRLIV